MQIQRANREIEVDKNNAMHYIAAMKNITLGLTVLLIAVGIGRAAFADALADGKARVIQFDSSPAEGVSPHVTVYISGPAAKLLADNLSKLDQKNAGNIGCGMENGEYNCAFVLSSKSELNAAPGNK